ncbi:MAG: DNA repair protein RecO [Leptospira sp.]|nr:DNA repair protein RecO [Leptospira sp.]
MGLKKDSGIVIQSRNIGDNDRVISLLSETEFRKNYFLRGIRKSKSRPIAASEIGSLVEVNYYEREGKEWNDVKEVHLLDRFDLIKSSVLGLYFISYISEIASALMLEGELHEKEAKLIRMAFTEVNTNGFHFGILPFLKIRLLGYLGIIPQEFLCMDCGEEIWLKKEADIQETTLDLFCGDCRSLTDNKIQVIRFLRDCVHLKFSNLFSDVIPVPLLFSSDEILNTFLDSYLGRGLKTSKEFYRLLKNELTL